MWNIFMEAMGVNFSRENGTRVLLRHSSGPRCRSSHEEHGGNPLGLTTARNALLLCRSGR